MRRGIIVGCVSLIVLGCADRPTEPGKTPLDQAAETVRSQRSANAEGPMRRGVEDEYVEIERAFPGFGGAYLEGDKLVAYTTNMNAERGIRTSLQALITRKTPRIHNVFSNVTSIELRQAQFSISTLISWQTQLTRALSGVKTWTTIDADEKRNKVSVGVLDAQTEQIVKEKAREVGIPENGLFIEISPEIHLQAGLRGTWRPTGAGIQIKPDAFSNENDVCTMGFNVTNAAGQRFFLTSAHCTNLYSSYGSTGDPWYQPCCSSGNHIGTVSINPPFNFSDPDCGGVTNCAVADVMAVAYNASVASVKQVAGTEFVGLNNNGGSITWTRWWPVSAIAYPAVGTRVDKMGRTSGWTAGPVANTCQHVQTATQKVLCAVRFDNARSGYGDSGAPVYIDPQNNTRAAVGILFAGLVSPGNIVCTSNCQVWYSPWNKIEQHLGTSFFPY